MRSTRQTVNRLLFTVAAVTSLSVLVRAQDRKEVTINETGTQAENLTSSQDGSVYFGSTAKGTIYRADRPRHCLFLSSQSIGSHSSTLLPSGSRIQANLPFSADSGPFTGSIPFAFSCASMPSSESTR